MAEEVPPEPTPLWATLLAMTLIFGPIAWLFVSCQQHNARLDAEEAERAARYAQAMAAPTPAPERGGRNDTLPTTRIPMGFSPCLARIRAASAELGVAPVNIVESNTIRVVRFNTRTGSVLITCDGEQLLMTDSPHRG